mmetsp:Transcript_32235/g.42509  ORF Transcript_32235/g.42509 Transcript_32235/m.42509 type:complete len:289 (+) Transcript_32235:46-912(+)
MMAEESGETGVNQLPSAAMNEGNGVFLEKYFREVDGPFAMRQKDVEPNLTWKCTNMPIKTEFRLPIPVDIAGSIIEYQFQTLEYDIAFSVELETLNDDGERESNVISEPERYDSHIEPFVQQVQMDQPGTLILVWNNSYSWMREKQLSYSVSLQVPSLIGIDKAKCDRALTYFNECIEMLGSETEMKDQLVASKSELSTELSDLKIQIEQLTRTLAAKTTDLEEVMKEETLCAQKIELCKLKLTGFTFRLFSTPILSNILSFGESSDKWALVCQDWASIISSFSAEEP